MPVHKVCGKLWVAMAMEGGWGRLMIGVSRFLRCGLARLRDRCWSKMR